MTRLKNLIEQSLLYVKGGEYLMSEFEIVAPDAEVNYLYGGDDFEVSVSDIAELLKGNKLVGTVNDEYVIIKLKENK